MSPAETEAYLSLFPRPPHRDFIIGRAFIDGQPVHVDDVLTDPDYDPRTLEVLQRAATYRIVPRDTDVAGRRCRSGRSDAVDAR